MKIKRLANPLEIKMINSSLLIRRSWSQTSLNSYAKLFTSTIISTWNYLELHPFLTGGFRRARSINSTWVLAHEIWLVEYVGNGKEDHSRNKTKGRLDYHYIYLNTSLGVDRVEVVFNISSEWGIYQGCGRQQLNNLSIGLRLHSQSHKPK